MSDLIGFSPNALGLVGTGVAVELLETLVDKGILSNADARGILERASASFAKREKTDSNCADAMRLIREALLPHFPEGSRRGRGG